MIEKKNKSQDSRVNENTRADDDFFILMSFVSKNAYKIVSAGYNV